MGDFLDHSLDMIAYFCLSSALCFSLGLNVISSFIVLFSTQITALINGIEVFIYGKLVLGLINGCIEGISTVIIVLVLVSLGVFETVPFSIRNSIIFRFNDILAIIASFLLMLLHGPSCFRACKVIYDHLSSNTPKQKNAKCKDDDNEDQKGSTGTGDEKNNVHHFEKGVFSLSKSIQLCISSLVSILLTFIVIISILWDIRNRFGRFVDFCLPIVLCCIVFVANVSINLSYMRILNDISKTPKYRPFEEEEEGEGKEEEEEEDEEEEEREEEEREEEKEASSQEQKDIRAMGKEMRQKVPISNPKKLASFSDDQNELFNAINCAYSIKNNIFHYLIVICGSVENFLFYYMCSHQIIDIFVLRAPVLCARKMITQVECVVIFVSRCLPILCFLCLFLDVIRKGYRLSKFEGKRFILKRK
ncbi:hypothetical protein ADUPG1_008743 [Aduncisulcus paluster]|uniref:Uncharacterized protein n=1 Tax=Aduncisulcus paluster TaxID=2918883 RepID=A0ABQ5KX63_9EUKA|nr:hypothetical protein ADUPG1_008743 [Aduncisulcus paluster]